MPDADTLALEVAPEGDSLVLRLHLNGDTYSIAWDQAARLHAGLAEALAMAVMAGAVGVPDAPPGALH